MYAHVDTERYKALEGLRGLAAISVIIFHTLYNRPEFLYFAQITKSVVLSGSRMVPVFFVLSGFFIFDSLFKLSKTHPKPYYAFVFRRVLRVMPLWIALLGLMFFTSQISLHVLLANSIFFFGEMQIGSKWFPVIPAWSLQAEVIFYILTVLLYQTIIKYKKNGLICVWITTLFVAYLWGKFGTQFLGLNSFFVNSFVLYQLHYFVAGIFIYQTFVNQNNPPRIPLQGFNLYLLETLTILFFLLEGVWPFLRIDTTLTAPAIIFLCLHRRSFLHFLLSRKIFRILGQASFGIYILQDQSRIFIERFFPHSPIWLDVSTDLLACIVIGLLAYHYIEKPFIQWSKRF